MGHGLYRIVLLNVGSVCPQGTGPHLVGTNAEDVLQYRRACLSQFPQRLDAPRLQLRLGSRADAA